MTLELIQIIEDDHTQAGLLDHTLRSARFRTNVAYDGRIGLEDIKRLHPALILLDVMLPGVDGYELCQRLRDAEDTKAIPIIMLTALASEEHRVAGLEFGADDYIAKPFSPREVVARVQAILRRVSSPAVQKESYLSGQLELLERYAMVAWRGRRLDFSEAEWMVLRRLARTPGEVVTWEELIGRIWGDDDLVHEHELDRLIGALRWKLEREVHGRVIESIPGIGYKLKTPH